MKARHIFLLVLAVICCQATLAQDIWVLEINVSIGSPQCTETVRSRQVTLDFPGMNDSEASGAMKVTKTSTTGAFDGTAMATGRVSCGCPPVGGHPNPTPCTDTWTETNTVSLEIHFAPEDGPQCRTIFNRTQGDKFSVLITAWYSKRLATPVVPVAADCQTGITHVSTTTTEAISSYLWQIADGSFSWKNLRVTSTPYIDITKAEATQFGLTGSQRFVRVFDNSCTTRSSEISTSFHIYLPPPSAATVAIKEPTCFGYDDGEIKITSVTSTIVTKFLVKLEYYDPFGPGDPDPFKSVYQVQLDNTSFPFTINKTVITSVPNTHISYGVKKGSWKLIIANNDRSAGKPIPPGGGDEEFLVAAFSSLTADDNYDAGDCAKEFELNINEPTKLVATAAQVSNFNSYGISCIGESDGSAKVNITGGTDPYSVRWSNGATSEIIKGLSAGNYRADVKDLKNCPASDDVILSGPTAMTITITDIIPTCAESTNGALSVTTVGGAHRIPANGQPDYTYAWQTGQTSSVITGLKEATYRVTVTDANGCTKPQDKFLDAPEPMLSELEITSHYIFNSIDYSVQCHNGNNGKARIKSITNGDGDYDYQWSNGEISAEAFNLSSGTQTLITTDGRGCKSTASIPLTSPPAVGASIRVNVFHNGTAITCHGESDGALTADITNAVEPIAYAWSSGHATKIATGLAAGNYNLLVTDARSCKATASFPLEQPQPVQPAITPLLLHHGQAISCPGENDGTLRASATGGTGTYIAYEWDNGPSTTDFTGLTAGTYSVTVTDNNLCTGTTSGILSDPLPVNPSITIATVYNGFAVKCHNGSDGELHASATGGAQGYTFEWNNGSTNPVLSAIPAGTYSLVANDANGCHGSTSLTIANPPLVTTTIAITSEYNGKHIRCHNESNGTLTATAAGGTNSFTFKWNTNATGSVLSGLTAGTYTVTATDMNGCEANDAETLINPEPVVASIVETSNYNSYGVRCHTFSDGYLLAAATGGTESFTYLWSNAETIPRASDLSAGLYSITITDTNGCSDTETAEITSPPVLNLSLDSKTDILCFDAPTGELIVTTAGGAGAYEYSLDNIDWQPSSVFNALKAARYTVHVRDDNGCIDALSETLTQPARIIIDFATTPAFCADPRGEAIATVTGGVGGYEYTWTDDESTVLSTTTAITNRKAGVYTLTVVDDNGCPMIQPVGIISSDGPQAIVKEVIDAKCSYSSDGSGMLEITDGDAPFTYRWPDGQTTIQGVNLAKGIYHVLVTDVNDCESVFPVEIGAPDELDISAAQTINPSCFGFCDGSIIVATAGGTEPYTYAWSGQSGAQAVALCAGGHSVKVKDLNGCEHEETFILEQPDPLQIQLTTRTLPLCFQGCDGTLAITTSGGNGGNSYSWSSGAQIAEALNICAGDHTIKVTDGKNCQIEKTYALGQPEKLQVVLSGKQIPVCHNGCDGKLEVTAFGGTGEYHYAWNTGAAAPSLKDVCSSDYTVSIQDDHGCSVEGTYPIENPPALSIDLGGSVTLCEGQTHDLEVYGNWVVYKWNSNVGFSALESRVTIDAAGLYWLDVHNSDGCLAQDTFLLETSIDLLKASFLLPKEAFVNDTIAMIDISWPLPETSTWTFPSHMHKILDMGDVVYGKFPESGIYEISLESQLGKCLDQVGKTIAILNSQTEETEGGRLGYKEEYVKEFSLYPNPTDGKFEIAVELREEGNASVSVWHTPTGYLLKQVHGTSKKDYKWNIDLRPATSGTYVIRLDHAQGKNYIRFIVK